MTKDEIRAESFNKIIVALNEIFPGIQSKINGDFLTFDNTVEIEISSSDNYDGFFNVTSDEGAYNSLWGIKPVVNIVIKEICQFRKQKVLDGLR